jgi:hypothetical protein
MFYFDTKKKCHKFFLFFFYLLFSKKTIQPMRIKLATSTPLPVFHCWFPISEKFEKQTIHHLRKKIVKDLELKAEPSNIQLLIDGFNLLPQTIIKDLVRDGDLIT